MPKRKVVHTDRAPAAIGPYSQAVRAGAFVFASGQIPLDPASGNLVGGDDIALQTERVLENLTAVLAAAGSSLDRVVRCDVFLKDLSEFAIMNEVYARYFERKPPARVTVEVSRLPKDVRVEISAIAIAE
jgi:2-iminobutanoate/2-iminopropanoate deaminase